MDSTVIDYVKYRDGHSDLGDQSLRVQIIAFPSNLTVKGLSQAYFSVPWENFEHAYQGVLEKTGLSGVGAVALGLIPVLDLFAPSAYYVGFWLRYWDNDIQREQQVFFETGSERKANQVIRKIFQYRDQYHRQTGSMSGPQRR